MADVEPTEGASTEERSSSLFGVLFAFLGLMLVFGLGVAVTGLRLQGADSRELYSELFEQDAVLPYGLRHTGGTAVANKQRWIRLEPDAMAALGLGAPEVGPSLAELVLPEAVLVGRYAGPVAVARQFETEQLPSGADLARQLDKWEENEDGATRRQPWTGLIDRGVVAWGPWEADYVHLREFRAEGQFFDLIRINLSTQDAGQILVGHWPLGVEGASVDPLVEVLKVMKLDDGDASSDADA